MKTLIVILLLCSQQIFAQNVDYVRSQTNQLNNQLMSPMAYSLDPQSLARISSLLQEAIYLSQVEDLCSGTFRGVAFGFQFDVTLARIAGTANQIQSSTYFKGKPHLGTGVCNYTYQGAEVTFNLAYKMDSVTYSGVISRGPTGQIEIHGTFTGYKVY